VRERDGIHITLIAVYSYNCSIVLLSLLISYCVYFIKFIIGIYVYEKAVFIGFGTICGFRHALGVLEGIPHRERGTPV